VLGGAQEQLSVAERARRERMRIVDRGFTTFDLSEDGTRVVLPLSGRVFVIERGGSASGRPRAIGEEQSATRRGGDFPAIDPRFSPDGKHVAYVRGHDLYVTEVASGRERRLTRGGSEALTHGLAEFIAQEEMGRFQGYFWSPDSRGIAYTEVDYGGVERFTLADPARPAAPAVVFPYPRAGTANALVRLGLIAVVGGATTWVKWDQQRYPYLARVLWKEREAPLTILVQTRDQRETALLRVDPRTGATRALHKEADDGWVDLDDDLPRWLPDGSGFLNVTERPGRRSLELRRSDGSLARIVVPVELGFWAISHIAEDSRQAHVLTATPVATTLYQVPLQGAPAALRSLTTDVAEHAAIFSKNGAVYVDTRTARDALPESTYFVRSETGWRKGGVLPSVAESPPFRVNLELTQISGASGRSYHAAIVRPRTAPPQGARLPVIVNVYGGPTSLTVKSDERSYLLHQWIADHGVVVVCVDNRGTARRDRRWSRAVKGSFGSVPLEDQVDALRALGARYAELDLTRVGVYGWSFGGYMAALAAMKRPDVFRVAVAGAPVVDWRDYDTHYTERYLGVPNQNPLGYKDSDLLTYAPRLTRPLLLIHGTSDDNVYFFHSLKLSDALFRAGKPHDFLPLSVTHQVPDAVVRERLWGRIVEFLLRHLR
jgi:dipeptidyl-peptidase-4